MNDMFLTIINMSLTASYVIFIILILRILLKRAPKIISYVLWSVVAFRLVCPVSYQSLFSLIPINTRTIPQNIAYQQVPQINSGIPTVDAYINGSLPAPTMYASVNPLQIYILIGAYLWFCGMVVMLIYGAISVVLLKRRLEGASHVEGNIYVANNLKTPFVLGVFNPRIYIPAGLKEEEKGYIIRHEQTHIRRLDHMIKPLAFFILCLHWFNPLAWLAFKGMSMDMELSCDERVIREMGSNIKKAYSSSLLSLATGRHTWNGSPLTFGEGNVKNRIKNVLSYKKPVFWISAGSIIVVIAIGGGLMANPIRDDIDLSFLNPNNLLSIIAEQEKVKVISSEYGETYLTGVHLANWLDIAENDWLKNQNPPPVEPEASIVINIDEDHDRQICFFDSEPSLVKVVAGEKMRYYSIQKEDYHYILEAVQARFISEQNDTVIAEPTDASLQTH